MIFNGESFETIYNFEESKETGSTGPFRVFILLSTYHIQSKVYMHLTLTYVQYQENGCNEQPLLSDTSNGRLQAQEVSP